MASCILRIPAFAPPDFAAPSSRIEDVVMSSPSPSGSFLVPDAAAAAPLYPERFGLTTTTTSEAAPHHHHHHQQQHYQATAPTPSSSSLFSDVLESGGGGGLAGLVVSRPSLPLPPCKIEPESQAMMLMRGAFLSGRQQQQFAFPGMLKEPAFLPAAAAAAALSPTSKRSFGSSEQYQEYEQHRNKLHKMAAEFSATSGGGRGDANAGVAAAAAAAGSPPPPSSSMMQQQQQEPEHEVHIWTERERRKKMRSMFVTLHSMLPKVPSKADKSTIVDEAINYIKLLEHRMQQLQRKKAERKVDSVVAATPNSEKGAAEARIVPETQVLASQSTPEPRFQTLSSSNVVFNVCGSDAFLTICTGSRRPSSLSDIFSCVIETHKLQVKNVQITDSSQSRRLLMMHVCTKDATRTTEDLKALLSDLTMHCA